MTPTAIIEATAAEFGVQSGSLRGPRRFKRYVQPRHLAMLICREVTDLSLSQIGDAFGGRDHGTVHHGCNLAERRMRECDDWAAVAETIKNNASMAVGDMTFCASRRIPVFMRHPSRTTTQPQHA